jgi:hypothetical protein
MLCAGPKKAALSYSGSESPTKHSKYNPVAERCSEFLNQVKDKAPLISKRPMDQPKIRVEPNFRDCAPNLPIENPVNIVKTLVDWVMGRKCHPPIKAKIFWNKVRQLAPIDGSTSPF